MASSTWQPAVLKVTASLCYKYWGSSWRLQEVGDNFCLLPSWCGGSTGKLLGAKCYEGPSSIHICLWHQATSNFLLLTRNVLKRLKGRISFLLIQKTVKRNMLHECWEEWKHPWLILVHIWVGAALDYTSCKPSSCLMFSILSLKMECTVIVVVNIRGVPPTHNATK